VRQLTHHGVMAEMNQKIADDYAELRAIAARDPQRAGHGGEGTWAALLRNWLPNGYEVGTRKYIVPELGDPDDMFETDIVVYRPGCPPRWREEEYVLSAGVAAAFSVKLTLDADGIKDGVRRAALLRKAMHRREGSPQKEIIPPYPVGLLAHSHGWSKRTATNPLRTPAATITRHLETADLADVGHPSQILDLVCVADTATWSTQFVTYVPPQALARAGEMAEVTEAGRQTGMAITARLCSEPIYATSVMGSALGPALGEPPLPIAIFVTALLNRLSYDDPTLAPLAEGLRVNGNIGFNQGPTRCWDVESVYSRNTILRLPGFGIQMFN
jgi:hypothetical protein